MEVIPEIYVFIEDWNIRVSERLLFNANSAIFQASLLSTQH
jgi:hypothetical protein